MSELPIRLKRAMDDAGVDQPELARRVNCTQGAISQILLGNTLRSKFLPDIADALGVDLKWLRGVSPEKGKASPKKPEHPSALLMPVQIPSRESLRDAFDGVLEGIPEYRQIAQDEFAELLAEHFSDVLAGAKGALPVERLAPQRSARPRQSETKSNRA